ncbi:MAG: ribbon-helix-helix protein, CopG family [Firmicutes bacterium]|nr:ribbon-helix-helix protein, CopG family [Bacillota bacterium]
MFSIRLPRELEDKLTAIAKQEGRSKADLVKEALVEYLSQREKSPFELGEDLFGRHGSGAGNLARDHERLLREKLHAQKDPH